MIIILLQMKKSLNISSKALSIRICKLLWFNHAGCIQNPNSDRDQDMVEWVVWFYVEPFTLHLNRDRGQHLLSPIVLVSVLVPVPVADTASVITP